MSYFGEPYFAFNRRILGHGDTASDLITPLNYLLNDEFTTDEAAPLVSPRTAEPTGSWTVVDPNNRLSVNNNKLVASAGGGVDNDTSLLAPITVEAGTAVYVMVNSSGTSSRLGFSDSKYFEASVLFVHTRTPEWVYPPTNIVYPLGVMLITGFDGRSYYFVDGVLAWIDYTDNRGSRTVEIRPFFTTTVAEYSTCRAAVLSSFADSSFLTDSIAAPVAGNTFTHEADGWLTFDLDTLPSAGTIDTKFRIQDASNYWRVQINATGDVLLLETVATVDTTRGTAAAAVSGSEIIRVSFNDETIRCYYDNTLAWGYGPAANFKTETTGEVNSLGTGGAISNLETLPLNPSGKHLTQLEQIEAGT